MRTRALVIGAVLFLAGCTPSVGKAPAVSGETFTGDDVTGHRLVAGTTVTLSFDGASVHASAGCNQMAGTASWSGDQLRVADVATTEIGCQEAMHAQDRWLTDLLTGTPTVTRDGQTLHVAGAGGTMTLMQRSDTPLEGTHWIVDGLATGDAVSSLPAGTEAGLTIEGGALAANLGCNTGRADVTVTGQRLRLGPLAATRMACPGPQMDVEAHVTRVLDGDVDYAIDGDRLTLRRGDVGLLLRAGD